MRKLNKMDMYELQSGFEFILEEGNREDIESLRRVVDDCAWNIVLRESGFKVEHDGPVTTIVPPADPNPTAQGLIKIMKGRRDRIVRRFFGPVPPVRPAEAARRLSLAEA